MITNDYIFNLTIQKYQALQSKNSMTEYFNIQRLLKDEEYAKIYYALSDVAISLERASFTENAAEIKRLDAQKKLLEKQKDAAELQLLKYKIKISYECSHCNDSGFNNEGLRCHCFYENLTCIALELIKVKPKQLATFSDDTLSESVINKSSFEKMKRYAEGFHENSKSLLFLGATGTGKTFNAQAIASEVAKKNLNVIFLTANEFNNALLAFHIAPIQSKQPYIDILTTCDLLIIDDLGTEPIYKNVTLEHFLFVISSRQSQKKPFIITTNLPESQLHIRYGERLLSRLTQSTLRLELKGKDLRTIKH